MLKLGFIQCSRNLSTGGIYTLWWEGCLRLLTATVELAAPGWRHADPLLHNHSPRSHRWNHKQTTNQTGAKSILIVHSLIKQRLVCISLNDQRSSPQSTLWWGSPCVPTARARQRPQRQNPRKVHCRLLPRPTERRQPQNTVGDRRAQQADLKCRTIPDTLEERHLFLL